MNKPPDQIGKYEVHPVAHTQPMMDSKELKALEISILSVGQLIPIDLYNDKIIDGRSRALACESLRIPVKINKLLGKWSEKDLKIYVDTQHERRNLTQSQKAIRAAREYLDLKTSGQSITEAEVIARNGISRMSFRDAKSIILLRPNYENLIFQGIGVRIFNEFKQPRQLLSVSQIIKHIKQENLSAIGEDIKKIRTPEYLDLLPDAQDKEIYENLMALYGEKDRYGNWDSRVISEVAIGLIKKGILGKIK